MITILGVDIGTSGMKLQLFTADSTTGPLEKKQEYSEGYPINVYRNGLFGDIEPEKWEHAFRNGCSELGEKVAETDVIALSGTTPGLTAIGSDGKALLPAILMLDQRSRAQAARIIEMIGLDDLLSRTGNMPVAGGCSLASILWIKENHPDLFSATAVFGHSNTYFAGWLTGTYAIDPSSASLSALYRTVENDLSWDTDIASAVGLPAEKLPDLLPSHGSTGRVKPGLAKELGLRKHPQVVIGGNDAVLAALSVGIEKPGQALDVNGTCEISLVCLDRCIPSTEYNVRAHALPGRWLTLYVLNAGGTALEWFREQFCREMDADAFYSEYLPEVVNDWLGKPSTVVYSPFLMGSRYSLAPLAGEFLGMTRETTREEILASVIRGMYLYQREHLKEISLSVPLREPHYLTGGAASPALIPAKKTWMRDCRYEFREQSSVHGAALLGLRYSEERSN